jgi:hypothetical protein
MKPLQAVVLRLFSLLALIAGVVMLGLAVPIVQVQTAWNETLAQLPGDWRILGFLIGGVLVVFGIFGLLPLGFRRGKSVAFDGDHGQIIIQLDPVERKLNKVLNKMPEVKKIRALVVPDKDGGPAQIRARAWLRRLPDQKARDIEMRVADYIEETATDFLGLEARTPVELVIEDIEINIDDAAKELQRHSQERAEEKELSKAMTASTADEAQVGPTVGQAAATAAAAAMAHQAFTEDSESTVDEEEGYVGVPASLALEDGGIYSPEIPGTATSEYVIGTSSGDIVTDEADVDDEDRLITAHNVDEESDALAEEEDTHAVDESPAYLPAEESAPIEPPEQDEVQIEYTLTTPGEPEEELPAAPTASVPMAEEVDLEDGDEIADSRFDGTDLSETTLPASSEPAEDYDTPLPPLEEIGPEEDTPYDYGIASESDEDEEIQGLPPLGELQTEDETDATDDTNDTNDKWRF